MYVHVNSRPHSHTPTPFYLWMSITNLRCTPTPLHLGLCILLCIYVPIYLCMSMTILTLISAPLHLCTLGHVHDICPYVLMYVHDNFYAHFCTSTPLYPVCIPSVSIMCMTISRHVHFCTSTPLYPCTCSLHEVRRTCRTSPAKKKWRRAPAKFNQMSGDEVEMSGKAKKLCVHCKLLVL